MTSSYWPPNSKFQFAYYDVSIFLENLLYLCKCWPSSYKFLCVLAETIFYKCSCRDFSFWQRHHGVFFLLKEACEFLTFCVYSRRDMTFSQNWILHLHLREQYLRHFGFVFAELWVCCSWDNKLSQICPLFFDQMPEPCSYFSCKVGFDNSIFCLRVNAIGKCYGISVTHLTPTSRSLVRVGRLKQFFSFFLTFHCTIFFKY